MSEIPPQETVEPTIEPATPTTEGVAGLIAAAVEQTLSSLGADQFAELVQRVRPPGEQPAVPEPVQPQADRPPVRIPSEPTEQQKRDHERYSSAPYPASWGYQRQEG
ncbi:hypothetical protein [[Mycobacterium] nativiensis]|uniref:Uncharacterized protein n=1 Tax=[Mycobacterium] nativiensis TaxID=2855503 RepID=A0ABU5Y3L4_9MYCO|nr:hypothetical protein [Mycolicibacter sp. MYC340]MEB3034773.1 hypothetical protein [Mycolicibacter sp. MYC340]